MIHLTKIYWENFKPDGILFEELVKELLECKYPDKKIQRTTQTHDGNRDAEMSVPITDNFSAQIWFECKYYKQKLSINAVSMTLVMAYIENAQEIVFFSYSPINRTFSSYLAQFEERSKIPVSVIDDCSLEAMIIKYWSKLKVNYFFSNLPKPQSCEYDFKPEVNCDVYQNNKKISCKKRKNELPCFNYSDNITLLFTVRNKALCTETFTIKLLPNSGIESFTILSKNFIKNNYEYQFQMHASEITTIKLVLRPRKSGHSIPLPKFSYSVQGISTKINPGKINVRWLAEAPLIGQNFLDILISQEKNMHNAHLTLLKITGKSGTGKTRLLKEIMTLAYTYEKNTFYWDTDFNRGDYNILMEELISHLEGLPIIDKYKYKKICSMTDQTLESGKILAHQLIYGEKKLSDYDSVLLADYLIDVMLRKEVWILLDNIQNCDEKTLDVLSLTMEKMQNKKGKSGLVLVFNDDFSFPGTKAYEFNHEITIKSLHNHKQFTSNKITEFSREEAHSYLYECLEYHEVPKNHSDVTYENFLDNMIDYCGTKPFYLQTMLLYLHENNLLQESEESGFLIDDYFKLNEFIKKAPENIFSIIKLRIETIMARFSEEEQKECNQIFLLLTYFTVISCNVVSAIFPSSQVIGKLLQMGILSENEKHEITFYHQYFNQYFEQIILINNFSDEQLFKKFSSVIREKKLDKTYIFPLFISDHLSTNVVKDDLKLVIHKIINKEVDVKYTRILFDIISIYLENGFSELISVASYIDLYCSIYYMTLNRFGLKSSILYMEQFYKKYISESHKFIPYASKVYSYLRDYCLALNNLNLNKSAFDKVKAIIETFGRIEIKGEEMDNLLATFLEVEGIIQYSRGKKLLSEKSMLESEKIRYNLKKNIKYSNHYAVTLKEFGYLYYYYHDAARYKEKICLKWDACYEQLQKADVSSYPCGVDELQFEISLTIASCLSDMIQINTNYLENKIDFLTEYMDSTQMPFYEVKIRLLKALYLLWKDLYFARIFKHIEECLILTEQAIEKCVVHNFLQDYPVCLHLKAIIYVFSGQNDKAFLSYKIACKSLQSFIGDSDNERMWEYFYIDMVNFMRSIHEKVSEDFIHNIKCLDIRKKILEINNYHSLQFNEYFKDFESLTSITDPSGKWNFPKI